MNRLATKPTTALLAISILISLSPACATRTPTTSDAPRPRAGDAPAPVSLTIPAERAGVVNARWKALLREQNITHDMTAPDNSAQNISATPAPVLAPVTLTLAGLPPLPAPLRLPVVGDRTADGERQAANERESLSRFLEQNVALTGAAPDTLSLARIDDAASNSRRATYEQRPFIYPLRGSYGRVRIDYDSTGRITNLTSTALPAAETVAELLRRLTARLTADEARTRLADETAQATELVILPAPRPANDSAARSIELRLAWEFRVNTNDAAVTQFAYVDALNGEIIRPVE